MKLRPLACSVLLVASPLLGFVLNACSSSSSDDQVTDASADHAVQQAEVDDANQIPCEPRKVLQTVCQQCHTRPTKNTAPFALQRLSDVMASYQGTPVREDMIVELEAGRMPLSPVTITADDKATLLAWLKSGAPSVAATTCIATDAGNDSGDGSNGDREAGMDAGDASADAAADAM